jgi:hypothetical protein
VITLTYGHLADFASEGANGKMIVVGIFDRVVVQQAGQVQMPICYLAGRLDASIADGSEHELEIRLLDGNADPILPDNPRVPVRFVSTGPGYPLIAQFVLQLVGLPLPGHGDYVFELRMGGTVVGRIPLILQPAVVQ